RSKIVFLRVHQKWSRSIPMFCDWRLSLRMATITYFRRYFNNFADDNQLLNTAVSFPIAFRKAYVYGAEAKLTLSPVHRFSGFVSYSYQVGSVYLPVTGGLLDRKSTRLNSSHQIISYAVFCLKKK